MIKEVVNRGLRRIQPSKAVCDKLSGIALLILIVDGKVDRTVNLHKVFVRPQLFDCQTPALLVADLDFRILIQGKRPLDRDGSVHLFGDQIHSGIAVLKAQCIALRDLCFPFFHLVLCVYDQVADFYRVIRGDLGNRAVHGRRKGSGLSLLRRQVPVNALSERNKGLAVRIPAAVISVRSLHMIGIHIRCGQILERCSLIAQIQTEAEQSGILRIRQDVRTVLCIKLFCKGKRTERPVTDMIVVFDTGSVCKGLR